MIRRAWLPLLGVAVALLAPASAWAAQPNAFAESLARGPGYAALTAFLGGLLVCLTPCVYPMIVITVSVFGARNAPPLKAAGLSTVFVLGIMAMFIPLGVAAGMTGQLFGSALSNVWVSGFVAVVFLALAASMFGAFDIALPSSVANRLSEVGGFGYLGAFLLGLVSGIVAAPCTGPVLGGILVWIGETQSPLLGAAAMAAFSVGLGLPFWCVGTFAIRLPKAGGWMVSIKTFFGIVLATAALYFARTVAPDLSRMARPGIPFAVGSAAVGLVGLALAMLARPRQSTRWPRLTMLQRAAGIVASIAGLFALVSWTQLVPQGIVWQPFTQAALERARAERKPVVIDFTADWCGACQELARHTFSDRSVVEEASRFVPLRVDATHDDDVSVEETSRRFQVKGLPTVILLDSTGREQSRVGDFVPAARFLPLLRSTK